jgi:hypothetical protein
MKENKQSLEIIQLANYVRPVVKESMTNDFVMNGAKNSFYTYIIDRYNGSPTNRAIIDSYAKFIYGKGLMSTQQSQKPLQFAMVNQKLSKKDLKNICQDYALFSEASMEVIYKNGSLDRIKHVPKNQILPNKMNEEGDIDTYWYSLDFNEPRKYKPVPIPAFTYDKKKNGSYIYIINSYQVGKMYFTDPVYMAGLPYAELEEEIANYCINHIKNGLSFGHIFNMNQGEPSPEVKRTMKDIIKREGQGSINAGVALINWNNGKETGIDVTALEVSDAHQQYEFLTKEATQKLLISHKVTSPILFGIKDNTGMGNNANEMESAFNELSINVITPMKETILDCLMELFNDSGITIDLDFIPLRQIVQPTIEEKTNLKNDIKDTDPIIADALINLGEVISDEWELIDEEEYNEHSINLSETSLNLATVISNIPLAPSSIDNEYFKVRFEYAGSLKPQREFCKKMINAGRVYRKEDIDLASSQSVNPGFGPEGTNTYDILKYKGGARCNHYFLRKVYLKKGNNYITVSDAQKLISDLKAQGIQTEIPTSGEPLSTIKPNNMPNNGFLN